MMKWVLVRDSWLFGGKIMGLGFTHDAGWEEPDSKSGKESLVGRMAVQGWRTTLRINPYTAAQTNGLDLIGTLLHKMVHIFIEQAAVIEEILLAGDEDDAYIQVFEKLNGMSGHGHYFQKLASAVEDAVHADLESKKIDLGRQKSMMMEYEASE